VWLPEDSRLRRLAPDLFAAAGMLLLVSSFALIDKTVNFPGWWALLPTMATFMLLAAGKGAWLNRRVLSLPVLTFSGRISYPLYLWHWPLLAFLVMLNHRPGTLEKLGLLVMAVGLAALTHYAVEQPLRFGRLARRAPAPLLAGLGALGGLGWALYLSDGLLWRYPDAVRTIAREQLGQDTTKVRLGTCFETSAAALQAHTQDCIDREPAKAPLLLLWGDSFAASLYPGLRELVDEGALPMRLAQLTAPQCPPLPRGSPRQLYSCGPINAMILDQVQRERPAMVVLGGSWSSYRLPDDETLGEAVGLVNTISRLRALGVARVVVVGSFPAWPTALPRLLLSAWKRNGEVPSHLMDALTPSQLALDAQLDQLVQRGGGEFISTYKLLCSEKGCQTTLWHDGLLYPTAHDQCHFTPTASGYLAHAMLPRLKSMADSTGGTGEHP
jgi:hypothetical protein